MTWRNLLRGEMAPHSSATRNYSLIAFILLTTHAALAWLSRTSGFLTGADSASYVLLARAIRDFHYREVFLIDQPFHRMYPPGYPFLLAVWSSIGGEGFNWLVLVSVVSSVGALGLLFSAIRRQWGPRYALASLVALAVNPSMLENAGRVGSESPFIFFQLLALWALSRDSNRPAMTAAAGGAAIAAAMVRSIGVTLIVSVGLIWLLQRRFRAVAIYMVVVALTVGLWLGWAALKEDVAPGGGSYLSDATVGVTERGFFSVVTERLTNKFTYPIYLYQMLPGSNIPDTPVDGGLGVLIVGSTLLAGLPVLFATWLAAFLYLAAYGALLWIWPWPVERFLVPMLIMVVPLVILGSGRLVAWFRPNWERMALIAVATLLALNGTRIVAGVIERQKDCVPDGTLPSRACLSTQQASFVSAIQYIRQSVPSYAVFVSGKREDLYYYTGRRAVSQTKALSQSPSEFVPFLHRQGVTYVLLLGYMPFDDGVPSAKHLALGEMLQANCQSLHLEASFPPRSFLFRVPSGDESFDHVGACWAVEEYLKRSRPARRRRWRQPISPSAADALGSTRQAVLLREASPRRCGRRR